MDEEERKKAQRTISVIIDEAYKSGFLDGIKSCKINPRLGKAIDKSKRENIVKIPIKDRTEEQHQFMIKTFHNGSVRDYLLSMGKFKNVKI